MFSDSVKKLNVKSYVKNITCSFREKNGLSYHFKDCKMSADVGLGRFVGAVEHETQGDQIGRFFANWVIVYFGQFLKITSRI
jgi:hypothetical protein